MNQVLILTKNILAEQEIQLKLQTLNYEVYCSTRLLKKNNDKRLTENFFKNFQYVILSETICESEVMEILPLLKQVSILKIRKVDTKMKKLKHQYLDATITNSDSIDEIRECLYSLKNQNKSQVQLFEHENYIYLSDDESTFDSMTATNEKNSAEDDYQFLEVLHRLSSTETKILSLLIKSKNEIVTRESICYQIWNEEANKSHLASLSSTITRIKTKFEKTNLKNKAIYTLWGRGYRVSSELVNRIQSNDIFHTTISGVREA